MVLNSFVKGYTSPSVVNFNIYLNSDVTPLSLTDLVMDIPLIPTTSSLTTVYLCGIFDSKNGVTNGGYVDISRLEILSSTGAAYPEPGGMSNEQLFYILYF